MTKQAKGFGSEAVTKRTRLYNSKGKKSHQQSESRSLSGYPSPSSHPQYSQPVSDCSSSPLWGPIEAGDVLAVEQDHHSPVFGPSYPPPCPQFIDLSTNLGYMNPFDIPSQGSSASINSTTNCNLMPSPATTTAQLSSHSAPFFLPPSVIPQALNAGCSQSESQISTPSAAHRGPPQNDPVSPSPRPCPPEQASWLAKKLYYREKNDGWSEPSQQFYSGSSFGGYSLSKSTSEGMEPSVTKDYLPARAFSNGLSQEQVKKESSSHQCPQVFPWDAPAAAGYPQDSASTLPLEALSAPEMGVPQNALKRNISAFSPNVIVSTSKMREDSVSSLKRTSSCSSSQCYLLGSACNTEEEVKEDFYSSKKLGDNRCTDEGESYTVIVEGHFRRTSKLQSKKAVNVGTYVLFEGDRGTDLGCVIRCEATEEPVESHFREKGKNSGHNFIVEANDKSIHIWKVHQPLKALETLEACRSLVQERKCQLDIVGAAYQYDMKKLTFYYRSTEQRVDFRSLLAPLYSTFHCRIWMERVDDDDFSSDHP